MLDSRKYEDLIGIPFEYGGRGEGAFDCYGLVRHLYKEALGVDIPDYKSPSDGRRITAIFAGELRLWKECDLKDGAVLLIRVPGNLHCGMYVGGGKFIHTTESTGGVAIERVSEWQSRVMGVYEYVGE